jgi:hypothetical protein
MESFISKIVRGASWACNLTISYSAFREEVGPVARDDSIGFRIVIKEKNEKTYQ